MSDWIGDWSPNTCQSHQGGVVSEHCANLFLWYSSFPEGEALGTSQSSQSPYTCRSFAPTKFVNVSTLHVLYTPDLPSQHTEHNFRKNDGMAFVVDRCCRLRMNVTSCHMWNKYSSSLQVSNCEIKFLSNCKGSSNSDSISRTDLICLEILRSRPGRRAYRESGEAPFSTSQP